MSKQPVSRRKFFKNTLASGLGITLSPALAGRIMELWAARAEHGAAALDLHQMMTVAAVAAQIIPSDDVPGAREAGVVEYINAKLNETSSLLPLYEEGLKEMDGISEGRFHAKFVSLTAAQQTEVMRSIEKSRFFTQVWKDTVEGYTRSWTGKKVVGYPGGAQPHGYHDVATPPKGA